jgi:quinol monooxygenase YgiN
MIAQPGQRDALIGYLLEGSGRMDGNYLYVVSADPSDPDALWIYEVWESAQHHQDSLKLESVQATIAKARPLIAGFSDRLEFTPVGGVGLPDNKK